MNLHRIRTRPQAQPQRRVVSPRPPLPSTRFPRGARPSPAVAVHKTTTMERAGAPPARRPDVYRSFAAPPRRHGRPSNPRRPTCGVRMPTGVAFARAPCLPRRTWCRSRGMSINTPGVETPWCRSRTVGAGDSAGGEGKERSELREELARRALQAKLQGSGAETGGGRRRLRCHRQHPPPKPSSSSSQASRASSRVATAPRRRPSRRPTPSGRRSGKASAALRRRRRRLPPTYCCCCCKGK